VNAIVNKRCSKCRKYKKCTLEVFPPNKKAKDGFGSWCRECYRTHQRNNRKTERHRKRARITYRKYRATKKGFLTRVWNHITNRCNNSNDISYKNYGGRGIKCLFESCSSFSDYVLNELKIDPRNKEIHRVDNNRHYERGNITFLFMKEHRKEHCK